MNSARDVIEYAYATFQENCKFLEETNHRPFLDDYKSNFTKILLLSIASCFETEVKDLVHTILKTDSSILLKEFIDNKCLHRQYHTLFSWNKNNANTFFSLFGQDFKEFMMKELESNQSLTGSIENFLEIGRSRNRLVHENYSLFIINDTVDDLYRKYTSAKQFIDNLTEYVAKYTGNNPSST